MDSGLEVFLLSLNLALGEVGFIMMFMFVKV